MMDTTEPMTRNNEMISFVRSSAQEREPVSWNRFFVFLAGKTNGAHNEYVQRLKDAGQIEVLIPAESDYIVVFCPVSSRVGTNVEEALDKAPGGKPIILVVMHPTFNPDMVIAKSRRLVNNPNVWLTVDVLFHEDRFLPCQRNNAAWSEIEALLWGYHRGQPVVCSFICKQQQNLVGMKPQTVWILVAILFVALLITIIMLLVSVS